MSQEYANMADDKKKEGRTPRDIMRVVFRRKFHFFCMASVFALAVLIGAHFVGLKYTGVTKFTLRSDSAAKSPQSSGNESLETVKLTLPHDLLDNDALEKVIKALGLDKGLPHNSQGELTLEGKQAQQALVAALRKQAQLSWEVRSTVVDLLSLSVTNDDPNLAQQIPNELVKNYIERSSAQITQRLTDSNSFLVSQVNSCSARLSELKNQRVAFETQHADMMPESPGNVQKRIDDLDAERLKLSRDKLTAQDRLREAIVKVAKLSELFPRAADRLPAQDANQLKALVDAYRRSRPASRPTTGPANEYASAATSQPATQPAEEVPVQFIKGPNPDYERLKGQLRDLEQALTAEQTLRRKTDAHPTVQALKARIVQVKKEIEDTPEVVTQKIYANPASRLNAPAAVDPLGIATLDNALGEWNLAAREDERIRVDLADIKARRDKMDALMANFAFTRQQWEELNNKVAESQKELTVWQNRRNDIQIALSAEFAKKRTHMATVQAAQEQFLPSSPKLSMILGGALLAALAGGAAWVLLLNFFDRTIGTTDKVAELFNLPVHGVIGEIVSARQCRWRSIKRWMVSPTIYTVVLICVAVAALSISMRLQFPELFKQWKADPPAFVYDNGREVAEKIVKTLKEL